MRIIATPPPTSSFRRLPALYGMTGDVYGVIRHMADWCHNTRRHGTHGRFMA